MQQINSTGKNSKNSIQSIFLQVSEMQLGYWLIVELHFKRFSSSEEGLCDSVYTLFAFCLSALAIWAAKWGYYTTIVQAERLSKRKLVEPLPCPFFLFPPKYFLSRARLDGAAPRGRSKMLRD